MVVLPDPRTQAAGALSLIFRDLHHLWRLPRLPRLPEVVEAAIGPPRTHTRPAGPPPPGGMPSALLLTKAEVPMYDVCRRLCVVVV